MLAYGMERRFAGALALDPPIDEFALEADEKTARAIEERFDLACAAMIARGAEIIIPADGVLNEFLVRRKPLVRAVEACPSWTASERAVSARRVPGEARATRRGPKISRHQMYAKPSAAMVEHVRGFSGQRKLESDFSGDR